MTRPDVAAVVAIVCVVYVVCVGSFVLYVRHVGRRHKGN
jgi:hypothetical protein